MKRFILALFTIFLAVSSYAQYAQPIKSRGSQIICEGKKLTKDQAITLFSDVNGEDRGQDYLKYRNGYKTGLGLSIGGASLAVVGTTVFLGGAVTALVAGIPLSIGGATEMPAGVNEAIIGGAVAGISGAAIMLAGIPTAIVYQVRMKNLASDYNKSNSSDAKKLTLGPASSGIGLALNF